MKKINELTQERSELIEKMEAITKGETLTDELRSEWTTNDSRIKTIDEEIALLERQELLNKNNIKKMENTQDPTQKDFVNTFRDWLKDAVESGKTTTFRADPILATTDTGIIAKDVMPGISILTSPAEQFLRNLGVTFFPNLTGNFTVPSMGEATAGFVSESKDGSTANMASASLTLAARRITNSQAITVETLEQTNPGVFAAIVQNLVNGLWNGITNDFFTQFESDAASQVISNGVTGTSIAYADIVDLEASIGGLNIGAGAYVMRPETKGFLKKTIALGTTAGPAIWSDDNTVNGYPAYGVPAAKVERVYFGDWSYACIGQWGSPVEFIVDPYTKAASGQIIVTASALVDSGVMNKRAFSWLDDASTY
jgi:HK97 family phage major capsid protein